MNATSLCRPRTGRRPLALSALTSAALLATAAGSLALAFVLVLALGTLAVTWTCGQGETDVSGGNA